MYRGEFKAALEHLDLVLIDSDPTIDAAIYFAVANAPVSALSFMAWIRLFQGTLKMLWPASAKRLTERKSCQIPTVQRSRCMSTASLTKSVETGAVQEQSALLVALAAEQVFRISLQWNILSGWAAFTSGDTETGIALMKQGLAAKRAGERRSRCLTISACSPMRIDRFARCQMRCRC